MSARTAALHLLAEVDAQIDKACPARATLDPTRVRARSLAQVWQRCADGLASAALPEDHALALAEGLAEIASAAATSFPHNLFWDFDLLAAELARQTSDTDPDTGSARIRAHAGQIARLHHLYGHETSIRFRYVHDFAYGYDWVKWIRRDPPPRQHIGPYDLVFLNYMARRGAELLALIAADDATYPTLRDERPRNPFPFSREPDAELALHRALAASGEIPVEAWRADARPQWRRDYAELRIARARELGLASAPG
jgi:hypothetical protein